LGDKAKKTLEFSRQWEKEVGLMVTKMVASVRNKGKLLHGRKNYQLFTLRVFVLRDDFSEQINPVIRGFAVLTVEIMMEYVITKFLSTLWLKSL
jgi:hypothetical protein